MQINLNNNLTSSKSFSGAQNRKALSKTCGTCISLLDNSDTFKTTDVQRQLNKLTRATTKFVNGSNGQRDNSLAGLLKEVLSSKLGTLPDGSSTAHVKGYIDKTIKSLDKVLNKKNQLIYKMGEDDSVSTSRKIEMLSLFPNNIGVDTFKEDTEKGLSRIGAKFLNEGHGTLWGMIMKLAQKSTEIDEAANQKGYNLDKFLSATRKYSAEEQDKAIKVRDIIEKIVSRDFTEDNTENYHELASSFTALGDAAAKTGKSDFAEKAYNHALLIKQATYAPRIRSDENAYTDSQRDHIGTMNFRFQKDYKTIIGKIEDLYLDELNKATDEATKIKITAKLKTLHANKSENL